MIKKTEIQKGWPKLLGAPTKGKPAADSLEGMGLVQSTKYEGQRSLSYKITPAGKKAIQASR